MHLRQHEAEGLLQGIDWVLGDKNKVRNKSV
jgi:hypothetical protein